MMPVLTPDQSMVLIQNGPQLDRLNFFLSKETQKKLLEIQKRAGDLYASGNWVGQESGYTLNVPAPPDPLTTEEVQEVLKFVNWKLRASQKALEFIANDIGLDLSPPPNMPPEPRRGR